MRRTRIYERRDWVKFRVNGEERWGVVTFYENNVLRIVDADNRRYTNANKKNGTTKGRKININEVQLTEKGVFLFDTRLDNHLNSDRKTADFWYRFCKAADWDFCYERVHSIADLKYFLGKRKIKQSVLIFSGHGTKTDGFHLTNRETLNDEVKLKIHESNKDKIILFSSCELGKNQELCRSLMDILQARALITYTDDIYDDISLIAEPFLLELIFSGYNIPKAVEIVTDSLDPIKTLNKKSAKKFPMVCFTRGSQ
ncbi:MAG: hypothetical protein Kow0090_14400 [Myxococcota bacterium]